MSGRMEGRKNIFSEENMTLRNFFEEYLTEYAEMGYENFIQFLRDWEYINLTNLGPKRDNTFMNDKDSVINSNAENFAEELKNELREYYFTWEQAINETQLRDLGQLLTNLEYYLPNEDVYTQKGINAGIEYNLLTKKILNKARNKVLQIDDIDDVFFIQWIGPFSSVGECVEWEKKCSIQNCEFNFYYISGIPHKKRKRDFYIGISERGFVCKRWQTDTNHVIHTFRDETKEIWIGRFSSDKIRTVINKRPYIEIVEWLLIYAFQNKNGNEQLKNSRKLKVPPRYGCIINQWFKTDLSIYKRKTNHCPSQMPDVFYFFGDDNVKLFD